MDYLIQKYRDIKVAWSQNLSGGGMTYGQQYVPVVRNLFGKVDRIYEFCGGPGFIGFSLLAEGLCNSLCISDINPEAIELLLETVKKNGLDGKVSIYLSDCLKDIPETEKWDLVVANPPHFNKAVGRGIITDDPDWHIHRSFYADVHNFLKPHGSVLVQENYSGSEEKDFIQYLDNCNLEHVGSFMDKINIENTVNPYYFLWSRKKHAHLIWQDSLEEIVQFNLSGSKSYYIQKKLKPYTKYRFEFMNALDDEVQITLFNEAGANLFKIKPLVTVSPKEKKQSSLFYLTKGVFRIIELKSGTCLGTIDVIPH